MIIVTIVGLIVFGLCLGSFVNALVWRLHEQAAEAEKKRPNKKYLKTLSISTGRSICPNCKHELKVLDLVPLFSWLALRGKCRYCRAPISLQYPLVEAKTAGLFVFSYLFWPTALHSPNQIASFVCWLLLLVGFVALTVYDLRWMLLPNRILLALTPLAAILACLELARADDLPRAVIGTALSVVIAGGIFYVLFQLSAGKWIGGGDVKLGWLLGLVLGSPAQALLLLFLASLIGTAVSLPLLALSGKKFSRTSTVPFGPFLLIAAVICQLFGASLLHWYQHSLIGLR